MEEKNDWIYLIAGISAVALMIAVFGRSKPVFPKKETPTFEEGNTIEKKGGIVVSIPKTKTDSLPLLYLFGGMMYANPDWMLKQIPSSILSRSVVVIAPYTMEFKSVKVDDILDKNNVKIDSNKISLAGFSAGGLNVQSNYDKKYRTIGLIDPSTRASYVSLPFTKNTIVVYNPSNWGAYPNIQATLPKLGKAIKQGGGINDQVNISHEKIPKYFFDKYQDSLK